MSTRAPTAARPGRTSGAEPPANGAPSSSRSASRAREATPVLVRFHNYNAFFAWWWQVDNVAISGAVCTAGTGGLVVGNVSDLNTGAGLNGATVMNLPDGDSTTTFATPGDPNVPDGFYAVYAGSGPQPFQASDTGYSSQTKSTSVIPNSTVRSRLRPGGRSAQRKPDDAFIQGQPGRDRRADARHQQHGDGRRQLQDRRGQRSVAPGHQAALPGESRRPEECPEADSGRPFRLHEYESHPGHAEGAQERSDDQHG